MEKLYLTEMTIEIIREHAKKEGYTDERFNAWLEACVVKVTDPFISKS